MGDEGRENGENAEEEEDKGNCAPPAFFFLLLLNCILVYLTFLLPLPHEVFINFWDFNFPVITFSFNLFVAGYWKEGIIASKI